MSVGTLISYFDKYLSLNSEEREVLSKRVVERKIRRKQFILQESDVCRHYTFVAAGCFKMYGADKKGNEHIIQFAAENDWITDIGSFHSGKPSLLYIEAIEQSVILQLEKNDLIHLYTHFPNFNRNFRVIIEDKYVELQNRVLQNISSTAEERYLAFLDQYPLLSARLPNTQIAAYLGITPEFLSNIRQKITKKKPYS